MKQFLLKQASTLLGVSLFVFSSVILYSYLKEIDISTLKQGFLNVPSLAIIGAFLCTALSYFCLTFYDVLALKYIKKTAPYKKVSEISFISYAFSNNLGFAPLTGGSIRYRLYSALGFKPKDVAIIITFCLMTFGLGMFFVSGLLLTISPKVIYQQFNLSAEVTRLIGFGFVFLCLGYIFWDKIQKKPITYKSFQFTPPPSFDAFLQIFLASIDILLMGTALYLLLPDGYAINYFTFMIAFSFAITVGSISNVPGGLGVFEGLLFLLIPSIPIEQLLSSLIIFRVLYFIVPFAVAVFLLGRVEAKLQKEIFIKIVKPIKKQLTLISPYFFGILLFANGLYLFTTSFVNITYDYHTPLLAALSNHPFVAVVIGALSINLARSFINKLDLSYYLGLTLFMGGLCFSFLSNPTSIEFMVLSLLTLILIISRSIYYKPSYLLSFSLIGKSKALFFNYALIFVLLLVSIIAGSFSADHAQISAVTQKIYTNSSYIHPLALTVIFTVFLLTGKKAFKGQKPQFEDLTHSEKETLDNIAFQDECYLSRLHHLNDKHILQEEGAYLMYQIKGNIWAVLGDPVGNPNKFPSLLMKLIHKSEIYNGYPVFYQISPKNLSYFLDSGFSVLKIGEEARINLETFTLDGKSKSALRQARNQCEKHGIEFDIIPKEDVKNHLETLKDISDQWLYMKKAKEKSFSVGNFNGDYLQQFPIAIAKQDGKIIGFTNLVESGHKHEIYADLMRYLPNSQTNVMKGLLVFSILWSQENNYKWFSLGMAPLSGLTNHSKSPLWYKIGNYIFKNGEHFYNFDGLRKFKEKFAPDWRSKYIAYPKNSSIPKIAFGLTKLISNAKK